ncbi:hypothetical protein [Prosthecobacter sp.]
MIFLCNHQGTDDKDTRPEVDRLHHRFSMPSAEVVRAFDFKTVPAQPKKH